MKTKDLIVQNLSRIEVLSSLEERGILGGSQSNWHKLPRGRNDFFPNTANALSCIGTDNRMLELGQACTRSTELTARDLQGSTSTSSLRKPALGMAPLLTSSLAASAITASTDFSQHTKPTFKLALGKLLILSMEKSKQPDNAKYYDGELPASTSSPSLD